MSKQPRHRIDYMPGPAVLKALDEAAKQFPQFKSRQDLIDKLVLTGWSALNFDHWRPPMLYGTDRDRWK